MKLSGELPAGQHPRGPRDVPRLRGVHARSGRSGQALRVPSPPVLRVPSRLATEGARVPDSSRMTRRTGLRNAVAAAVALPLLTTAQAAVATRRPRPRLDVMTYNLRFASTEEPNSWAARRPVMRE